MLPQIITPSLIPCVCGGGAGTEIWNWYICVAHGVKWGARERPLAENVGLSERPLTGKTGDFGAKNNKETYIFKSRKSGTKNCTFLKRGSFGAAQVEKVVFRSGQSRKMGVWAIARRILVLSWYGSTTTPPPPPPDFNLLLTTNDKLLVLAKISLTFS